MKIATKLALGAAVPVLLIWALGFHATTQGQASLRQTIETASEARAAALMDEIDRDLVARLLEWRSFTRHPLVQTTLTESNAEFETREDPEASIDAADAAWRAATVDEPLPLMRELQGNELATDLRARLAEYEAELGHAVFGEVFVTNRFGANVAQTHRTSDFRQSDESWWTNARRDGVFVGDVAFDDSAGVFSTELCLRVEDSSGRFAGVLKAVLDIAEIIALMDERAAVDGSGTAHALFTIDGRIVHMTSRDVEPLEPGMEYLAQVAFPPGKSAVTVERDDPVTGAAMLVAVARSQGFGAYKGLGWMVMSERASDEAFAAVHTLRSEIFVASAAATLVTLLLLGFLALSQTRRLRHLTTAVVGMSEGELGHRVKVGGSDELSQLGTCFNVMAESLEGATEQLENRAQSLSQENTTLEVEIERRTEVEAELVEAREKAETGARLKSEFLANMSHELRTPLNGVIGTTELVLGTELNAEQRDLLETTKTSADLLLSVINDVLDFSKIEAGKLDLYEEDFEVRHIVGMTLRPLAHVADQKGLELVLDVRPDVPPWVVGDAGRLRQVIINLVGNALKFTSQGEVSVTVDCQERTEEHVVLHVAVRDTGVGVPEEKKDLIFEAFAQADGSVTRLHGGTGLGLSISTQLVRLMQGRIWLESQPGKGSTFSFTVRFGICENPVIPADEGEVLAGLRVLVVDDNETNRRILDSLLRGWNLDVTCVDGGPPALVALESADESGSPYDLVLLDQMMPGMDGFEVAQALRRRFGDERPVVMMLSSASAAAAVERCRESGIHSYLTKPVLHGALRRSIAAAMVRLRGLEAAAGSAEHAPAADVVNAPEVPEPPAAEATPSTRVLLVEDNALNQMVAQRMLERLGYVVDVAESGLHAVTAVGRASYDVVLMDVQMPGMDGFEATTRLRELEKQSGRRVPIVAMTAHATAGYRQRCLDSGMDDYVAKPVRGKDLEEVLSRVLSA